MYSILKKLIVLGAVVALGIWVFDSGFQQYLKPDYYQQLFIDAPIVTALTFFLIYVVASSFSLAAILTLVAGAVFGFKWGLLIVSFASTVGATLAFIFSRVLLKSWVQEKFGRYLKPINKGIERDGPFYLFTLRLIPIFPFFVINFVMGLMPIKTWTFYWVSQVGMLAGTAVYVNAGVQLGEIDQLNLQGILNAELILSFVLLGLFPWLVKGSMGLIERRRKLKGFNKPKTFDDNLIVIGAGSAGLVSAYIAAATQAKVTLIEKHKMGGDCLNTGCVPSKALLHAAKVAKEIERGRDIGVSADSVTVDFEKVMASVHKSIQDIEPHDSVERYTGLGVNAIEGEAEILSPWEVKVNGEVRTAKNLIIATGGRPRVPNIPGIESVPYVTSDTLWETRQQPKRLLVLGGGPIGCELSQAFARLGSQVTLVEPAPQLLGREDQEVAQLMKASLEDDGISVHLNSKPIELKENGSYQLSYEENGDSHTVEFDLLLLATGREANTQLKGLQEIGVALDDKGFVQVDEFLQTSVPGVYACGDVIGGLQFTHVSSHEAWYATVNSLFGFAKRFKVDYRVIPWVTYTDPEVGRVGLSETEAKAQGIDYEVHRYDLSDLDRAIVEKQAKGFVKVLTPVGKDTVIGATIVGLNAGELIAEMVISMKHGITLNKLLGTIHAYPTLMEANKFVAGNWKRSTVTEQTLKWADRLHSWRR